MNVFELFGTIGLKDEGFSQEINKAIKAATEFSEKIGATISKVDELDKPLDEAEEGLEDTEEALKDTTKETDKLGKEMDDTAEKTSSFGSKFSNFATGVGKVALSGLGAAATAFTGLAVKSLQLGGDLEQNIGGSEAVFQQFAGTVQDVGTRAFETMGLAQSDFLSTANKMGALLQGSGIDIETSMELSTSAMQRAADVASINNIVDVKLGERYQRCA